MLPEDNSGRNDNQFDIFYINNRQHIILSQDSS